MDIVGFAWRTGLPSKIIRATVATLALLALVFLVVFVVSGLRINRQIDLCMDETSGSYISDQSKREEVCR